MSSRICADELKARSLRKTLASRHSNSVAQNSCSAHHFIIVVEAYGSNLIISLFFQFITSFEFIRKKNWNLTLAVFSPMNRYYWSFVARICSLLFSYPKKTKEVKIDCLDNKTQTEKKRKQKSGTMEVALHPMRLKQLLHLAASSKSNKAHFLFGRLRPSFIVRCSSSSPSPVAAAVVTGGRNRRPSSSPTSTSDREAVRGIRIKKV